jgi:tRNA nucleotidyltransferase (CCA-adding enzyme)
VIKLPVKVQALLKYFQHHGFECYVVGGFVRDQLIQNQTTTTGIDFTTNATPQAMLKFLSPGKYENRFGTVVYILEDIAKLLKLKPTDYLEHDYFEITTYRTEQGYSDQRHPDQVKWGKTLTEDLTRRDFTINAMAYDGKNLVDIFNGQKDLKTKTIRTVGESKKRFQEDALRLMRAVRFASQLNFQIEAKTLLAMQQNAHLLKKISLERIRDEFLKIITSEHPAEGIMFLRQTDLLKVFLPELSACFGVGQVSPKRHHQDDVGTHLVKSLATCTNPDPIVRLACLLHDLGKPSTRKVQSDGVVTFYNHEIIGTAKVYEIAQRLKLSKKETRRLTKLVRYHQFSVNEKQTDNALRRFIRNVGPENLQDIIDLRTADRLGSGVKPSSWRTDLFIKRLEQVQQTPFSVNDLKIDGHDVMKTLNCQSGPQVGQILKTIFDQVVEGQLENERAQLLAYLKKTKT